MSRAIRRRLRGFSLIEVVAVLVVVGLVTAMASVSLSGVTRAQRVEDAAERLRVLDARVRVLAEREHRPWRLRLDERGAAASPRGVRWSPEEETLRVRLDPTLRLQPWVAGRAGWRACQRHLPPGGAVGACDRRERRLRLGRWSGAEPRGPTGVEPAGSVGAFAGGTGRFTALSREAATTTSGGSP